MGLKLVIAPTVEPVSLAEARLHLNLPSSETGQDALVAALITAAREHCEAYTHRRFVTQTVDWVMDAFPAGCVEVPGGQLQSVTSVSYVDTAGATQVLAGSGYQVDIMNDPGRLMPAYGAVWPPTRGDTFNAVTVRFVCGYGLAPAVPRLIKVAMLLVLGHLWEHREENSDFQLHQLPLGAERLLSSFRLIRF